MPQNAILQKKKKKKREIFLQSSNAVLRSPSGDTNIVSGSSGPYWWKRWCQTLLDEINVPRNQREAYYITISIRLYQFLLPLGRAIDLLTYNAERWTVSYCQKYTPTDCFFGDFCPLGWRISRKWASVRRKCMLLLFLKKQ